MSSDPDKDEFYRRVQEIFTNTASNSFLLSSDKYNRLIQQLKEVKTKIKKGPSDYRRIRRYNVVTTPDGEERLVTPAEAGKKTFHFVKLEEMYDIIREYHLKMNHAGRTRMMKGLKTKYKNITASAVTLYISLCDGCKNRLVKRDRVPKPNRRQKAVKQFKSPCEMDSCIIRDPLNLRSENPVDLVFDIDEEPKIFPELYSRGQIEIMDVKTDEEYKYLMVYRNLVTKFVHLKPLKTISIKESVNALLDIFLVFGAPNILQSQNGISISKQICRRIFSIFPDIKIVSAAMVKNYQEIPGQSNEDILKMLRIWLKENTTQKWYDGVKYVQYTLNNSFNISIVRTPSESVFGYNPKRGIASFMTKDEYIHLFTESDLRTALEKRESGSHSDLLILDVPLIPSVSFIKLEQEEVDPEVNADFIN